jgi:quercetin dioxygenase-like cupin family protein
MGETNDRPLAVPTVQQDTERATVTEWRFAPGAHTGWHVHAYDYIVVPMTTATLMIETTTGTFPSNMVAGQSYARDKGAEHDVINNNDFEVVFIEIELKP